MTAMEQALVEACVPVPTVKERVWNVIKERNAVGTTMADLCKRLRNISDSSISVSLHLMKSRGMIHAVEVPTRPGTRGAGTIFSYKTDMERYELVKPPTTKRKAPTKPKLSVVPVTPVITLAEPEPATKGAPSLDALTIAEARSLYQQLHKMFG